MSSKDQSLLDKLFEVEKSAEALVSDARKEAGSRIAAAKEKAEAEVARAFEAAVKEANAKKAAMSEATISEYEKAVVEYRSTIDSTRVDEGAFREACASALNKK